MKKKVFVVFFPVFIFFVFPLNVSAQTTTTNDPAMTSTQFDMSDFPLWAKDLRRAEIVAFGSFPFAYFFANFSFDAYRCAAHGWDRSYAPWPFKGEGAVDQTQSEKAKVLWIAAGSAVLISLIDYGIVRYKRSREEREIRELPPGTPIIIRTPLDGESESAADTEMPLIPAGQQPFSEETAPATNTGTGTH